MGVSARCDRGEVAQDSLPGLRQHAAGAKGHEVTWLHRRTPEPDPGGRGDPFPPAAFAIYERDRCAADHRVKSTVAEQPVLIPIEAYVSEAYARAENDKLWAKVWQSTCREEEIPKVGDYVTYDILDESIIVVRSAPDKISAFYNVCQHRGRRLAQGCGEVAQFRCRF